MATSKVSISNQALGNLGVDITIESLTENSKAARVLNRWYDHARIEVLESYNWSFARKRQVLAKHTEDPPLGAWAYRYQVPADCVAFRSLEQLARQLKPIPFAQEMADNGTMSILTDMEDAKGIFTFDQQNTAMFSKYFITTLSYLLAYYCAMTVTGKRSIRADMGQAYNLYVHRAPAMDANNEMPNDPLNADWIEGR